MRTYSHFLITALIWDILERRQPPIRTGRGFLIGAVLPDVPLLLLTLWYLVYRLKSDCPPSENDPFYGPEYNNYFYNNNIWKLGTSLFHAPFLIMVYASFGAMISRFSQKWGHGIMWFAISCGLHSVLDIMTHVEDGVLVFFPFNWDYRFHSWISYYDPKYGGTAFTIFEYTLDALLIIYFMYRGLESSLTQKRRSMDVALADPPV